MPKSQNRVSKKRLRTQDQQSKKKAKILQEDSILDDLIKNMSTYANTANDNKNIWLFLDVALNKVDFRHTLHDYDVDVTPPVDHVEILTKTYEEAYMRECYLEGDRPCQMGTNCECNFIDLKDPFVGVSFVNPDLNTADLGMCILCIRKQVQLLYYKVVSGAIKSDKLIQSFGNICNKPGEYHDSAMLIIPPHGPIHCMPVPIVAHQRNHYKIKYVDGYKHLIQQNVYFEDF